jgi:hypothetical protein
MPPHHLSACVARSAATASAASLSVLFAMSTGNRRTPKPRHHVIDPWPRYVGDRRIPGNGDRLSRAVGRYNQGSNRQPAPPIFSPYGTLIGISGAGGGGGGAGGGGGGTASGQ